MAVEGKVTVSHRALMQLAAYVTSHCDGVKVLTDKNSGEAISRMFTGKGEKGVYLKNTKQGIELELCVICKYGTDANALCDTVRERITKELADTGFKLKKVAVNICGVEK